MLSVDCKCGHNTTDSNLLYKNINAGKQHIQETNNKTKANSQSKKKHFKIWIAQKI